MKSRRATSLLMALLVLSLGAVIVFSLTSLSTLQLRTSQSSEQEDHARNLAESALYLAIDQVCRASSYGTHGEVLSVPVSGYDLISSGNLTFSGVKAANEGIGCSFNNLGSKQSASSPDGRNVPGETCLLVGQGRSGNARVQVECMYYRPAFPTGLVTGGTITADGLHMAGMMPGVDFLGDLASHAPVDLHPVDLHSNAGVNLSGGSEVSGDISAVTTVTLSADTKVRGEVRQGIAPQSLPRLDIQQIRAGMLANGVNPLTLSGSVGSLTVGWYSECVDSLVVNGDLNLDGGLLYVPGSVQVHGRVRGRGALLAHGPISIEEGNPLSARDVTVVASDAGVTLSGGTDRFFHGLVYAGGNLSAHDMTLVGSVVCQSSADLHNSVLVQTEVATRMVVGRPVRSANHDDVFFWYINRGEPDPVTRQPRYDYYMAIYTNAFTPTYNGA
ncbi:MAG: hypothetical protein U0931_04260, partial [Vulcanimicrobiota bacterium]